MVALRAAFAAARAFAAFNRSRVRCACATYSSRGDREGYEEYASLSPLVWRLQAVIPNVQRKGHFASYPCTLCFTEFGSAIHKPYGEATLWDPSIRHPSGLRLPPFVPHACPHAKRQRNELIAIARALPHRSGSRICELNSMVCFFPKNPYL